MVQGVSIVENSIVNINPATGEEISRVPCSTTTELDKMVLKSSQSQKQWRQTPTNERIALLKKGLSLLAEHKERLSQMIVKEMGKTLAEAETEAKWCTSKDEFLDILEMSLQPKSHGSSVVLRHPVGVVCVFSPWNFPADEIMLLVLPALGAGNTVIVKPSEVVPETGALVVNTLSSVLPENVVQLAQGDASTGAYLVEHDGIDLIAMTGSSATGKNILKASLSRPKLKRFVLELGGKDPMIVFADADLDKAVSDAVRYSISNAGQVCCSFERIFVAEKIYDEFLARVAVEVSRYKVGNGMEPDVKVGPLVSHAQRDSVRDQVQDAIEKGARLLYQSTVPIQNDEKASFFPITVLADVKDGMKIYREETFGPVVSISSFNGSEELAIELANDTEYGLAGSVYTQNLELARRVADGVTAGQVSDDAKSRANILLVYAVLICRTTNPLLSEDWDQLLRHRLYECCMPLGWS
jgi:acyl-CoA reductase-like NAD-dependent aldehyde dehydrogenase